jgi:hypothetical protein
MLPGLSLISMQTYRVRICHFRQNNATARFKKCYQLFEYKHFFLLRETSGCQNSNLNLNVVQFLNINVN